MSFKLVSTRFLPLFLSLQFELKTNLDNPLRKFTHTDSSIFVSIMYAFLANMFNSHCNLLQIPDVGGGEPGNQSHLFQFQLIIRRNKLNNVLFQI